MTRPADPFPFQREGVRLMHEFGGRCLLADEMGLGKTLQALWFYRQNPEARPAVVVCPAALKYMWERMAAVHIGARAFVCETRKPPRGRGFARRPANLYVINYEILPYWLEHLHRLNPNLVIIEECQRISNPRIQQSRAVRQLAWGADMVVGISGTPFMNRPMEIWHICNILWADRNPYFRSPVKFGYRFCKPRYERGKIVFRGADNQDELHTLLKENGMIRRLKADVQKQLPKRFRTVVPLELHDPKHVYREAATDFVGWARRNGLHRAANAGTATALVRLGYLLRLAARYMLKPALAWCDAKLEETGGKIVLFGHHRKLMEALERHYAGRCVRVDGSVTGRKRDMAVERFQTDRRIRVFIGNDAAKEGLTLTAANIIIFLELFWRPGDHRQAEDRIHRIGQRETCWMYFLVAHGTVMEWLAELLDEKQTNLSAVLDGGPTVDDLDIYKQLMQRLIDEAPRGKTQRTKTHSGRGLA